jgi:hypothetical protein
MAEFFRRTPVRASDAGGVVLVASAHPVFAFLGSAFAAVSVLPDTDFVGGHGVSVTRPFA